MLWRLSLLRQHPAPFSLHHRCLTSSATSQAVLARAKFVDAVNRSNRHAILTSYRHLRSILSTSASPNASHFPDDDILLRAMTIMSKSSVKNETNITFIIYADLVSIFSRGVTPLHQSVYVQALLSRGWLEQARLRLADYPAQTKDYNVVMNAHILAGKCGLALGVFTDLLRRSLDPDEDTYRMVLRCLSETSDSVLQTSVSNAMDVYLSNAAARRLFTKFFWPSLLAMFASTTSSKHHDTSTPATSPQETPNFLTGGLDGGPLEYKSQNEQQIIQADHPRPHSRSRRLLSSATKVSDMKKIGEISNGALGSSQWAMVIDNASQQKGLPAAIEIYAAAKQAGVLPTFEMVSPLIHNSCDRRIRSSEDQRFRIALQFYQEAFSEESGARSSDPVVIRKVYDILLRTLADTVMPTTSFPVALSLIRDMMALDVRFTPPSSEKIPVMLIRASPSHDAAFEIYSLFREQEGSEADVESGLDDSALMAFLHLSYPNQPFPPVSLFFLLLGEMQRRGYTSSRRAYTVMLSRIAQALKTNKSSIPASLATVQHIHKRLLLDTSLSPDTTLLNALMNAYNYSGALTEALKVWEMLFIQGKYDHASLSIVLDTLSFAGASTEAAALISKLKKSGFSLTRDNWQSWLELLCRANKIEQATRLVCFDMKRSEPPITPDIDHIETLLKYAWNVGRRSDVQAKIKKYLPTVWSGLPENLRE